MHTLFQFIARARLTLVDDTTKRRSVESLWHKLLWCTICCLKSAFYTCTVKQISPLSHWAKNGITHERGHPKVFPRPESAPWKMYETIPTTFRATTTIENVTKSRVPVDISSAFRRRNVRGESADNEAEVQLTVARSPLSLRNVKWLYITDCNAPAKSGRAAAPLFFFCLAVCGSMWRRPGNTGRKWQQTRAVNLAVIWPH